MSCLKVFLPIWCIVVQQCVLFLRFNALWLTASSGCVRVAIRQVNACAIENVDCFLLKEAAKSFRILATVCQSVI